MINIQINQPGTHTSNLFQISSPDEIRDTLHRIHTALLVMFAAEKQQQAYQRLYQIADNEIVGDFNGDTLYMALGLRGMEYDDLEAELGIDIMTCRNLEASLVKPSHAHLSAIATLLRFPMTFFTQDGTVDRDHKHTFICYAPDGQERRE